MLQKNCSFVLYKEQLNSNVDMVDEAKLREFCVKNGRLVKY